MKIISSNTIVRITTQLTFKQIVGGIHKQQMDYQVFIIVAALVANLQLKELGFGCKATCWFK
jgi:hypothetical protein